MTRVLLLHQPTDGGVGRHVTDLGLGLTEKGYEVVTCGPSEPDGLGGACRHVTLNMQRAVAPCADVRVVRRFASIVRAIRPALIHAHSSKAGAIARAARPAHPGCPVIYTPHGYAFAGYFTRDLERLGYREIERALAPLASRVVCVCEAEGRLARSVGPAARVRVVHNGLEAPGPGEVDKTMSELAARGPVICTLTLLRPGKGLETLIDAMPVVRDRLPHVQLAIWGGGPDLDALQRRAVTNDVRETIHFLGPTPDPRGVLRGADVFVLPSWAEAFPYVILEAMSAGTPIVSSDVGGIREAITDAKEGLLVASRDADALADALVRMIEEDEAARRMAQAARLRVGEQFTRERMIDGIARVYAEVS